jgi:hypothetical protein
MIFSARYRIYIVDVRSVENTVFSEWRVSKSTPQFTE